MRKISSTTACAGWSLAMVLVGVLVFTHVSADPPAAGTGMHGNHHWNAQNQAHQAIEAAFGAIFSPSGGIDCDSNKLQDLRAAVDSYVTATQNAIGHEDLLRLDNELSQAQMRLSNNLQERTMLQENIQNVREQITYLNSSAE